MKHTQKHTQPSDRWYNQNRDQHVIGRTRKMSRTTTGSRARAKKRYSEKLREAIRIAS
ncbi:MAG: hypothetical protein U9Q33_04315 [Campylobacterota bacterium]|nr:hypothetical protein [Campylobacterota bacterium]